MAEKCSYPSTHLDMDWPDWSFRCRRDEGGCGFYSEHHEGPQAALEGFQKPAPGFEAGDTHYSHARSFLLGSA